jgi:hypothetical protein
MKIYFAIALSLLVAAPLTGQQTPTAAAASWWSYTTALSSDEMQGRDTGTAAYQRAADYVASRFQADGLQPAGDNGSWFQQVPMHQVELDTARSSAELVDSAGAYTPLAFLYDITLTPRAGLPAHLEGDLVFLGYGELPPTIDLNGKIARRARRLRLQSRPQARRLRRRSHGRDRQSRRH